MICLLFLISLGLEYKFEVDVLNYNDSSKV